MELRNKIKEVLRESTVNFTPPEYIYHGTSKENAHEMMKYGFSLKTYWGAEYTAEDYAKSHINPVVIKIPYNDVKHLLEPNSTLLNFYEDRAEYDDDYYEAVNDWNNSKKDALASLLVFDSAILPPNNYSIIIDNIREL